MNTIKSNLKLLTIIVASAFLIISCGETENRKTVKNLEKCFGNIKTINDAEVLSQEEAIEIAQCMLPHLQSVKDKVDKMSREEAVIFLDQLEVETNKSKYSEIIKELNYRKVKQLAALGGEINSSKPVSSNRDWDKILDDYENYIDEYLKFLKKANQGDMSALLEYNELLEKAEKLDRQLTDADDQLTNRQLSRFTKIQNKMTEAMLEMYYPE